MNTAMESLASNGPASQAGRLQLLTFQLGADSYAMDIAKVREIIQAPSMTPVPMMPSCVKGVINLRGTVVPIVDLKGRLGLDASSRARRPCIIILDVDAGGDRTRMGLWVDSVSEVVELGADDLEPAPTFGNPVAREFIHGIGNVRDRFVAILDAERILRVNDLLGLAH